MATTQNRLSLKKRILFALLPVFLIFASAEILLRLLDYRSAAMDPYDSFVLHKPVFVSEDQAMRTSPTRRLFFHDQFFPREKPKGTIRFFALGGSTTFGSFLRDPFNESYPSLLALALESEPGGRASQSINCGGSAYASYRLLGVAEECLTYSPDFIVLMTGHNEFLEPRHYAKLLDTDSRLWHSLRLMHVLMNAKAHLGTFRSPDGPRLIGPKPVLEADYIEEKYIVRDQPEIAHTLEHFTRNLDRIVELCRQHEVPLILCTVTSNLRDWQPFVTRPGPGISEDELNRQFELATSHLAANRHREALETCNRFLEKDPNAAAFHFLAAKSLDALGDKERARRSYIQARDTDAFPHRGMSSFNDRIREIATNPGVHLFDADAAFTAASPDGIPGNNLFIDNCHPNAEGHRILADGLGRIAAGLLRN